jgi:hypothetical protein
MLKRSSFVVALASLFALLAGGTTASARLSAPSLTATSAVCRLDSRFRSPSSVQVTSRPLHKISGTGSRWRSSSIR